MQLWGIVHVAGPLAPELGRGSYSATLVSWQALHGIRNGVVPISIIFLSKYSIMRPITEHHELSPVLVITAKPSARLGPLSPGTRPIRV